MALNPLIAPSRLDQLLQQVTVADALSEARRPVLDLRGQIATLETELDAAVDAALEA